MGLIIEDARQRRELHTMKPLRLKTGSTPSTNLECENVEKNMR